MCETNNRALRVYAAPCGNCAWLHMPMRSDPTGPVRIDEANYPVSCYRNGIVITGQAVAPNAFMPAITIDSVYAAFVSITLRDLKVYHDNVALKIEGGGSCTLKVEGNVCLAGSVGIQGGSGTLTLDAAPGATLQGIGVRGEGFETAICCALPSDVFPGSLTLAGAGNFEFGASGPFAGIRCPEGTLTLAGASKLTVSGGCSSSSDHISGPGGAGIYARDLIVTTTHPDGLASAGGNAERYEGGCGIVAHNVTADGRIVACGGEGRVGGDGCWLQAFGKGKISGMADVILKGGAGTCGSRGCGLWIQNNDRNPIGI